VKKRTLMAMLLWAVAFGRAGADLKSSKHNLSASGPGSITATRQSRICIFCHTPHGAAPAVPLWNHASSPVANYSTYASTTLTVTTPLGQPTGASKLCLSCHDGTVAIGQTVNDGLIAMINAGSAGRMPQGDSVIGTDLADDHPISFPPNPANPEVVNPNPGDAVRLDDHGEIQCTSCHDPHTEDRDPVSKRFLVKSNRGAALCLACHKIPGWMNSSHQSSRAPYARDKGAHTGYLDVADNGCEGCHRPHSGGAPERLLKKTEEETCLACHDGSVASSDIAAALGKPYAHPTMTRTPSSHDAAESHLNSVATLPETNPGAPRHAECADCHDPHSASGNPVGPAGLPGSVVGAWGVDGDGIEKRPAQAEYEICYKCHADAANKPQPVGIPNPPYPRRRVVQFNARLEFDPQNPSYHPVEAQGRNPDVPSLLPGYTTASTISCTDCHNSDSSPSAGGTGANGPHGSSHRYLLERNYDTGSGNHGPSTGTLYALCFKCHSESSILSDETFKKHRMHIVDEGASCSVCHDPHGISSAQGNTFNNSHLINFDAQAVRPNSRGQLRFEDLGNRSGACYLSCHNVDHEPEEY